jgi:hypothetical protein
MKKPSQYTKLVCKCAALLAAVAAGSSSADAQSLTNGLVSYWPLSSINNNASTSDVQGGLDFVPIAGGSVVSFSGANITLSSSGGTRGTNGYLTLGNAGLLGYQSPDNSWGMPATPLPPTQYPNWTVSMWVKGSVASMPSGGGDRIFSCGWRGAGNNPVLDINTGGTGGVSTETTSTLDNFVRQSPATVNGKANSETTNSQGAIIANFTGGSHRQLNANPWDGTWHNLTMVAQMITNEPYPII